MSKNKKTIFTGAATALITPFREGRVDFESLERILAQQISGGISALVVAGTTGEAATLTPKEHMALIRFTADEVCGRVPVIAGCSSNCTENAVRLALSAHAAGADALLAVTPYYNKATPEGLYRHYKAIADATPLPLILYNVPSRTGLNLTTDVCSRLAEHPRIAAVKEASGNIAAVASIIARCGDSLDIYSGNDDMTLPILSLGGKGVISVLSNILPAEVSALCGHYAAGRCAEAAEAQLKYIDLINTLFAQVNPVPVKTAMSLLGLCHEEFRLPLCPLSDKEKEALTGVLKKYEIVNNAD
jgi:4-hydroxy-tetrahydrodipicolinate synthase